MLSIWDELVKSNLLIIFEQIKMHVKLRKFYTHK